MFFRSRKHLNILVSRYGATVYQDGRYLHVDVKLSIKSARDRNALHDVINAISDALATEENPIAKLPVPQFHCVCRTGPWVLRLVIKLLVRTLLILMMMTGVLIF